MNNVHVKFHSSQDFFLLSGVSRVFLTTVKNFSKKRKKNPTLKSNKTQVQHRVTKVHEKIKPQSWREGINTTI